MTVETGRYDSTGDFIGHDPRRCGEHRTVGDRAWCLDDGEWCSDRSPCHGCRLQQEFICSGCESYLGTLNSFAPRVAVVVAFKCPDCGTVNRWGSEASGHA